MMHGHDRSTVDLSPCHHPFHGPSGHDGSETIAPIHPDHRRGLYRIRLNRRLSGNETALHTICLKRQTTNPMGGLPAEIGVHQHPGHDGGIGFGNSQTNKHLSSPFRDHV